MSNVVIKRLKWKARPDTMSPYELSIQGGTAVGYITELSPERAQKLFPGSPLRPSTVYLLAQANGIPIGLTDDRNDALAMAKEAELEVCSVH